MFLLNRNHAIKKEELLFSNKALAKIIIPLIAQSILGVLVGAVDTMMVSYAGEAAVSGVSLVSTLDTVLINFFTAMVAGGAVVIAQTMGQKDSDKVREAAKQLLYIVTIFATILTVAVQILRKPLLSLLFGSAEPDVLASAHDYFFFISLSFPLLAINEGIYATFRSTGNTLIALLASLGTNVLNVCGNAILIMGLDMGAAGAAIATTISRGISTVVLLILILNKKQKIYIEHPLRYRPNPAIIKNIFRIGVPNGVENTMFQFGRLLTQSLISAMGTASIAANAVALTLCNFQYMANSACSTTAITVVGRCIGAGQEKQAKYYARRLLFMDYVGIWAIIAITLVVLNPALAIFNLSPEATAIAKRLFTYHAIVAVMIYPISFMLPSCFRAASDVHFSMVISMISMWAFRVAGSYVFSLETVSFFNLFSFPGLGLGIMGVWITMTIDWLFRATFFLIHFLRSKWLRKKSC